MHLSGIQGKTFSFLLRLSLQSRSECVLLYFYLPEDAEDHDSCGKRYEGDAVTNGVANLHLPEKLTLMTKKKQQ